MTIFRSYVKWPEGKHHLKTIWAVIKTTVLGDYNRELLKTVVINDIFYEAIDPYSNQLHYWLFYYHFYWGISQKNPWTAHKSIAEST